ncbi:MAG: hypothetical protein HKN09_09240 [Saprospiraceae bacterium]|nr:hypothetical protein [Saprospiraceae bacterium]
MDNYIKYFYISVILLSAQGLCAQIPINNASFEGLHSDATMPYGWFSVDEGTTPDILPEIWGVYNEPMDGESFVGLITRQDGTNESIGQRLASPLKKNTCYTLGLGLAHSDTYTGYNKPLYLRIWISNKHRQKQQLIFKSPLIESLDWQYFNFEFTPENEMQYIILEAFISEERPFYKGNILIDNMSFIQICQRA